MTTTTDLALPDTEDAIQPSDLLDADSARALTDRIQAGTTKIQELIITAYQGRAWVALGYASWDEYISGEFASSPLALPRETRQEAVQSLKKQGLSLRAIASVTGTSPQTVANDAAAASTGTEAEVSNNLTPEQDQRLAELDAKINDEAGSFEVSDEEADELRELRELAATPIVEAEIVEEPAATKGLDGKEYKAKPKKEKAAPAPKVPATVKAAKRVVALLDKARIAYDELMDALPDDQSKDSKDERSQVDQAMAYSIVDFADSAGLKAPVRWTKLAN